MAIESLQSAHSIFYNLRMLLSTLLRQTRQNSWIITHTDNIICRKISFWRHHLTQTPQTT